MNVDKKLMTVILSSAIVGGIVGGGVGGSLASLAGRHGKMGRRGGHYQGMERDRDERGGKESFMGRNQNSNTQEKRQGEMNRPAGVEVGGDSTTTLE